MPGIIKPMRLGILTKATPYEGGAIFTVTALGLFDLLEPDYLLVETGLWSTAADQLPPGSVLDLGAPKPNGELIVAGSAIPPGGNPVDKLLVEASVGPLSKRVAAIGNRVWERGEHGPVFSDPEPFTHMPLIPQLAFGGEGVTANPVGRGYGARGLYDAGYKAPLPNLEDPRHPILEIGDTPAPAWFGPYPPDAPWRRQYMGTYDRAYMKTHFPGYPADFDTRYFLTAPADQQLDGFWNGDEEIRVAGMSSSHPTIDSRLPGIRARAFVQRTSEPAGFHELHMKLDTVWLFGSVNKGLVAFRGSTMVEDIEGDDIAYVMIAYERMDDPPRDISHYQEVYRLRRDPDEKIKYLLADYQLSPEIDPAIREARRARKLDAFDAHVARFKAAQDFSLRKQFEANDMPEALLPTVEMPKIPPVAVPTKEEIERGEADFAELLDGLAEQKKFADTALVELEALRQKQVAESGIKPPEGLPTLADLAPDIKADPAYAGIVEDMEIPTVDAAAIGARLDEFVAGMPTLAERSAEARDKVADTMAQAKGLLAGGSLDAAAMPGASDEEQFVRARAVALDLPEAKPFHDARQQIAEAARTMDAAGIHELMQQTSDLVEPERLGVALARMEQAGVEPEAAAAGREAFARAESSIGKVLPSVAAEEAGAGFESLLASITDHARKNGPSDPDEILRRIQAFFDVMEPMVIDGRRKTRRVLPKPIDPMPRLGPVAAKRLGALILNEIGVANLAGRDLAGADLAGADLANADLTGTLLENANLDGANLTGVTAQGTVFTGASLRGTCLAEADIKDANFNAAVLDGADFTGARIEKPGLVGTSMAGIVLARAEMVRWSPANMDLSRVSLDGASIASTTFIRCTFDHASFRQARLFKCVFIEGSAEAARFDGSSFEKAGFIKVALDRVRFDEASLVSSGFIGNPSMRQASFAGVKCLKSSWMGADLQESCFLKATLKDCNLMMADARRCDFRLATLANTLMLRADFRESDFFGAALVGAQLRKADLSFASLRRANAYSADFSLAKLIGTDLHDAHLVQTAFRAPETVT
ncbi:DUF2169 family type VI secretion system accessory protein [Amorphus coralli]|uniref:DUF2169 family type VI secretion system accessory protein n=1 Tax=Amorphus coralli TaxID=340680 RepID=UPI0003626175|nr:DUF2169 domain-containing protein [Amorphus coralli]